VVVGEGQIRAIAADRPFDTTALLLPTLSTVSFTDHGHLYQATLSNDYGVGQPPASEFSLSTQTSLERPYPYYWSLGLGYRPLRASLYITFAFAT
jgi:hypothetical protein